MLTNLQERERAVEEEEQREVEIARGNPLLNTQDFNMKRRWDDDVVFKNQARGTEGKDGKEFVNDLLRSDFHKRFMVCIAADLLWGWTNWAFRASTFDRCFFESGEFGW
jgi:hypothetical protein